jgi:lipopolysaccharide export system protein LptC
LAGFDNAYSRAVAVLKIALPLVALGLLSTLFLFSRQPQQGEPLPFPDLAVLDLAREQRLGAPVYSGVTAEGTTVSVAAESLRPDPQIADLILGTGFVARLVTPEGISYDISAAAGEIDRTAQETVLRDDVRIDSSAGYSMVMGAVRLASDLSLMQSLTPVEVTGPLGQIDAGQMTITRDPETGGQTRLVFSDGVNLLYVPAE